MMIVFNFTNLQLDKDTVNMIGDLNSNQDNLGADQIHRC